MLPFKLIIKASKGATLWKTTREGANQIAMAKGIDTINASKINPNIAVMPKPINPALPITAKNTTTTEINKTPIIQIKPITTNAPTQTS